MFKGFDAMRALAAIAAVSLFSFAVPAFADDLVYKHKRGPETLAPYDGFALWQIQARCAEIATSTASDSISQSSETTTTESAAGDDATTTAPTPQVDPAAQATSTFDLDTLDAEICAGVPAAM